MQVANLMEEVAHKINSVDDTDVVYKNVTAMVNGVQEELRERIEKTDGKFTTQIRKIYSDELSHAGMFGDKVKGKENKFGTLKQYLLDQDKKNFKLDKELKELVEA